MTTTTEAQRITGIDRGKHVTFHGTFNRTVTGTLVQVKHLGDGNTTIVIQTEDGRLEWDHVPADRHIEITGIATTSVSVQRSLQLPALKNYVGGEEGTRYGNDV